MVSDPKNGEADTQKTPEKKKEIYALCKCNKSISDVKMNQY